MLLAFSCKGLYHLFISVLGASELPFLRLPLNGTLSSSRVMLLAQLENTRWASRGICQRLHPRKDFVPSQLQDFSWKRKYGYWSGIVYLCPCIAITHRDHIIEYLKGKRLSFMFVDGGILKRSGPECLVHVIFVLSATTYHNYPCPC